MGQAESRDEGKAGTAPAAPAAPAQGGAVESLSEALGLGGCSTPCKGERIFAPSIGHVPAGGLVPGRDLGAGAM
jgi:hypothetical protein